MTVLGLISGGNDGGVTVLAGELEQRSIEGDQRGIAFVGIGEQIAIANPLGGRLGGERRGRSSECGVEAVWLRIEFYARIAQPMLVHAPGLSEGERLLTHDGLVREQAQQADLGVPRKMSRASPGSNPNQCQASALCEWSFAERASQILRSGKIMRILVFRKAGAQPARSRYRRAGQTGAFLALLVDLLDSTDDERTEGCTRLLGPVAQPVV